MESEIETESESYFGQPPSIAEREASTSTASSQSSESSLSLLARLALHGLRTWRERDPEEVGGEKGQLLATQSPYHHQIVSRPFLENISKTNYFAVPVVRN